MYYFVALTVRLCGGHTQRLPGESGGAGSGGGSLHVLLPRSCQLDGHVSLPLPSKQASPNLTSRIISAYIQCTPGRVLTCTCIALCLCADIWIRMQLQQRGGGAVPDGSEAAAHADEAAKSECEGAVLSDWLTWSFQYDGSMHFPSIFI